MTPTWAPLAIGAAAIAVVYALLQASQRRDRRRDADITRHESAPLPRRIPGAPVDGIPLSEDARVAEIAALSLAWRDDPAPEPNYRRTL